MKKHFITFKEILICKKPLIFALSEIWQLNFKNAAIQNYNLTKKERKGQKKGGGVAIYVRDDVTFKRSFMVERFFHEDIDVIAIDIVLNKIKILIISVYRPPDSSTDTLITNLKSVSATLKAKYSDHVVIFIGDFNDDLYNKTSKLLLYFNSTGFAQLINSPTRLTTTSQTIIDHVYVNNLNLINQSGVMEMGVSDHLSVWITLNGKIRKRKVENRTINYRKTGNISKIDSSSFGQLTINNNMNTSDNFLLSLGYLEHIFDYVCPPKTITVSKATCPWSKNILIKVAKKKKKQCLKNYNSDKSSVVLHSLLKEACKSVMNAISTAKNAYLQEMIKNSDSRIVWKFINKTMKHQKTEMTLLFHVDQFNDYYANLAYSLTSKQPPDTMLIVEYINSLQDEPDNFSFKTVTVSSIERAISAINSNKKGTEGIPTNLLKKLSSNMSYSLACLINEALSHNEYPQSLKVGTITPIVKVEIPKELKDYRPITMLPLLSKVFEKVIHFQMTKYLRETNAFSHNLCGFRKGYSVETALHKIRDRLILAKNERSIAYLVLLDFSKAFDLVDHLILIKKMKHLGFSRSTLTWTLSYLRERYIITKFNNVASHPAIISTGVPQGSILGPVLYNIYSYDLMDAIRNQTDITVQYADDTQFIVTCKTTDQEQALTNICSILRKVNIWASSNNLILNASKTQILRIQSRNVVQQTIVPPLEIRDYFVDHARNLGVIFDSRLSWNHHIDATIKKTLACFHMVKQFTDEWLCQNDVKTRKMLFDTLLLSQLHFAVTIVAPINQKNMKKLNKVIKICASIINRSYVKTNDLQKMKVMTFEQLQKLSFLRLAKASNNNNYCPTSMKLLFRQSCDKGLRSDNYENMCIGDVSQQNTYQNIVAKNFNSLPLHIKCHFNNSNKFVPLVKQHLLKTC